MPEPVETLLWHAGRRIDVTHAHMQILRTLAQRIGRPVGYEAFGEMSPNLVKVHICAMRRKLPHLSIRWAGTGYVLDAQAPGSAA